jgi:hypothetical protein
MARDVSFYLRTAQQSVALGELRMKELWRPIFGGDYSVSNLGRLRREKAGQGAVAGRILKPTLYVQIYRRAYLRHKLVAQAFLGPCPPGKEVNHIDGVRPNCRVSNLEYLTHKKNMEHASRTGLMAFGDRNGSRTHPEKRPRGMRHPKARLTEAQVFIIKKAKRYTDVLKLAKKFGVSSWSASNVWYGRTWKHL